MVSIFVVLFVFALCSSCIANKNSIEEPPEGFVITAYRGGEDLRLLFAHTVVYAVDPDGNEMTIPDEFQDIPHYSETRFSPDRQWIVYSSRFVNARAGGNSEIYLVKVGEENNIIQLTNWPENDINPAWSSSGTKIVYFGQDGEVSDRVGLQIVDVSCIIQGEEDCDIDPQYLISGDEPDWSPDDGQMVFATHYLVPQHKKGAIYVITLDEIPYQPVQISARGLYCRNPQWSPDGTKILYYCTDQCIYIASPDGSENVCVAKGWLPQWSPDGTQISFTSSSIDEDLGEVIGYPSAFFLDWNPTTAAKSAALYVINVDGTGLRRVTQRSDEKVISYFWIQ